MSDGVLDRGFNNRPSPDSRIRGPWRWLQSDPGAGGSMRNPVRRRKTSRRPYPGQGKFRKDARRRFGWCHFRILDLFETDADFVARHGLTQTELPPARAYHLADMRINWIWLLFVVSCHQRQPQFRWRSATFALLLFESYKLASYRQVMTVKMSTDCKTFRALSVQFAALDLTSAQA